MNQWNSDDAFDSHTSFLDKLLHQWEAHQLCAVYKS